MMKIKLPIKTVNEANCFEHWRKKHARHKAQQNQLFWALNGHLKDIKLPCQITFTRIAPRKLDSHDNLPHSFKWLSDALADLIFPNQAKGQADNDSRLCFKYEQKKGGVKEYAIEIEIVALDDR